MAKAFNAVPSLVREADLCDQRLTDYRLFVGTSTSKEPGSPSVWRELVSPAVPDATLLVFGSTAEQARITLKAAQATQIPFHLRADKQQLARLYETATALICMGAAGETS